jgi:hypothetical protein
VIAAGEFREALRAARLKFGRERDGMAERENGLGRRTGLLLRAITVKEAVTLVTHPSCQQGLGVVLDPLIQQGGDLAAQIGGAVQP